MSQGTIQIGSHGDYTTLSDVLYILSKIVRMIIFYIYISSFPRRYLNFLKDLNNQWSIFFIVNLC